MKFSRDLDESTPATSRSLLENESRPMLTQQITQNEADFDVRFTLIDEVPEDHLWVLSADDPDLADKVITSVIKGQFANQLSFLQMG